MMRDIREHVRLRAFPQADRTRHHLLDPDPDGAGTILLRRGDSAVAHDCATCGATLLEGCRLDRLPGVVFGCRACGGYSVPWPRARRRSPEREERRVDEQGARDAWRALAEQGGVDEKFRRLGDDVAARARAAEEALAAFRAFWARDVAPLEAAIRRAGLARRLGPVRAALRRLDAALAEERAALAADGRWLDRLAAPDPAAAADPGPAGAPSAE